MTIREYISRLKQSRANIAKERNNDALKIALDATTLVKLRIQQRGENADGQQYEGYTPDYGKLGRKEQGYQADYVDFTRTGRMWANTLPKITAEKDNSITVEIRARDAENEAKQQGQFKKRGNILELSESEVAILQETNKQRIIKRLEI